MPRSLNQQLALLLSKRKSTLTWTFLLSERNLTLSCPTLYMILISYSTVCHEKVKRERGGASKVGQEVF